jgi:hypothetical protein
MYNICRKITKDSNVKTLQMDLERQGEWAVQNWMKINPGRSKAIKFTIDRVTFSTGLLPFVTKKKISGTRPVLKYFVIIIRSDLNWMDQVNLTALKAWKASHFVNACPPPPPKKSRKFKTV